MDDIPIFPYCNGIQKDIGNTVIHRDYSPIFPMKRRRSAFSPIFMAPEAYSYLTGLHSP